MQVYGHRLILVMKKINVWVGEAEHVVSDDATQWL